MTTPTDGGRRPRGFSLIELLVSVAVVATLAGLTLCGVMKVRASAGAAACSNNLRQIGQALHAHQGEHGRLPPQTRSPGGSKGSSFSYQGVGWHLYALPYVEQKALWDAAVAAYTADPDPWGKPHAGPMGHVVRVYTCPSDARLVSPLTDPDGRVAGYTSYAGVNGNHKLLTGGVFGRRTGLRFAEITDGLSQTVAVGERPPPLDASVGWWYTTHQFDGLQSANDIEVPTEAGLSPGGGCAPAAVAWPGLGSISLYVLSRGRLADPCDRNHFWSLHPGGANFLKADGSVALVRYGAWLTLHAMGSVAGGETVGGES